MEDMRGIQPHGGKLVNRILKGAELGAWEDRIGRLASIVLGVRETADLEMIGCGAYSPLTGFMGHDDYRSVVQNMHLADGLPWPVPVTIGVDDDAAVGIHEGEDVALLGPDGNRRAVLHVREKFARDLEAEALHVYRTSDRAHPGVAALFHQGSVCLGGQVDLLGPVPHDGYQEYRLDPAGTRKRFAESGWKTVVGFQTRNPIHRAHEYIQKCALELVDGLLIHPLVGETKADDVPLEVRMRCYETMVQNYFPQDRVIVAVLPAAMRFAGPREAVFHALVRKNYGCTHFIVGRDHAGVGDYYGSYDAQRIFDEFDPGEIGIVPMKFEHAVFCRRCQGMATSKTCPHDASEHVFLSGRKVREMLARGERPPLEFSRPEVADELIRELWCPSL